MQSLNIQDSKNSSSTPLISSHSRTYGAPESEESQNLAGSGLDAKHRPVAVNNDEGGSYQRLLGEKPADTKGHYKVVKPWAINPRFNQAQINILKNAGLKLETRRQFRGTDERNFSYVLHVLAAAMPFLALPDYISVGITLGLIQVVTTAFVYFLMKKTTGNLTQDSARRLGVLGLSPNEGETEEGYKQRLLTAVEAPDFRARYVRHVPAQIAFLRTLSLEFDKNEESKKSILPGQHRSRIAGITGSPIYDRNTARIIISLATGIGAQPAPAPLEPEVTAAAAPEPVEVPQQLKMV